MLVGACGNFTIADAGRRHNRAEYQASCTLKQKRSIFKYAHQSVMMSDSVFCTWHAGTPTITEAEKNTVSTVLEQLLSGYLSE